MRRLLDRKIAKSYVVDGDITHAVRTLYGRQIGQLKCKCMNKLLKNGGSGLYMALYSVTTC